MHFYNGICFQLGCLGWLSSSTDGKKQIHERKSFVFGTLYRLSSIFNTCDLYYFDPQNPDFLVIIEWKAVMSYMLGYSKSIQVCVFALYNVFSCRRKPLITCLDNMYKIQLGWFFLFPYVLFDCGLALWLWLGRVALIAETFELIRLPPLWECICQWWLHQVVLQPFAKEDEKPVF